METLFCYLFCQSATVFHEYLSKLEAYWSKYTLTKTISDSFLYSVKVQLFSMNRHHNRKHIQQNILLQMLYQLSLKLNRFKPCLTKPNLDNIDQFSVLRSVFCLLDWKRTGKLFLMRCNFSEMCILQHFWQFCLIRFSFETWARLKATCRIFLLLKLFDLRWARIWPLYYALLVFGVFTFWNTLLNWLCIKIMFWHIA